MGADFRWPACGPVLMCVISATGSTTKEMRLNKLTSIQKSNNIASHLGTPGFMTSWSCISTVFSTVFSVSLLGLRNEQLAMYCRCSGFKFFSLCLLTNEWSTKKSTGKSRARIPIGARCCSFFLNQYITTHSSA